MKLAILYQQSEPPAKDDTKELVKIKEDCVAASQALKIKGLVRIDCREDKNGVFKIFDFNAKPNITGGVRPNKKSTQLYAECFICLCTAYLIQCDHLSENVTI